MPQLDLMLVRRSGAPRRPSHDVLAKLCARAWRLAPAARRKIAGRHKRLAADVMLVGDPEIAQLNASHMRHRGTTDVLSFPLGEYDPERGAFHLGEIVASFETARREAAARKLPCEEELARYVVHGFLHLIGYEDDTDRKRQAMHALQEKIVRSQT